MGRLLVVVELPILSHLGSIARNGAGLNQSNVAIDCAEDHVNDQMPPLYWYVRKAFVFRNSRKHRKNVFSRAYRYSYRYFRHAF